MEIDMNGELRIAEKALLDGFRSRRLWSQHVDLEAVCKYYGCATHGLISTLTARGWGVRGCAHSDDGYILRAPVLKAWEEEAFVCEECGIVCSAEWGNDASPLCAVCATRDLVTVEQAEETNPRRELTAFDRWIGRTE